MILYIDITEFVSSRLQTGIQRVIKEFIQRAIFDSYKLKILYFSQKANSFVILDNTEVVTFLQNITKYKFTIKKKIDLFSDSKEQKFFFDLDSVWNSSQQRKDLYLKLKNNNFQIITFIYDLIPIQFPNIMRENSKNNFPAFLHAVEIYSDLVFFDSVSTKQDFIKYVNTKNISMHVVYLGSDFLQTKNTPQVISPEILQKKYILFVGTIEPRKKHALVLDAFEEIQQKYEDIHLVFIGKIGWKVEVFSSYLNSHPLKNKYLHHYTNIDDNLLDLFYKNAFIVTYISDYEGYGLPIAESLQYSNITITSKNSSLEEVGLKYADYIDRNTKQELVKKLSLYIQNRDIYTKRRAYIKEKYIPLTWDKFYANVITAIMPNIYNGNEND